MKKVINVKKARRLLAVLLTLAMAVTLAACSSNTPANDPPASPGNSGDVTPSGPDTPPAEDGFALPDAPSKPVLIQFAGGASGGTFFLIANAVAQVLNTNYSDYVSCSTQATSGSVEILNLLENSEVDFGWSQSGMAAQAVAGTAPFDAPHNNISSVVYGYPNVCHVIVTKDSGIESVADLACKTFSVGGLGSAAELNMREICSVYGLDYLEGKAFRAENASDNDFPDMISNRQIDGGFSAAAIGAGAVVNCMTTGNCKLVSLSDEAIAELCALNPAYFEYTIEAGTYANQDYDVKTVAVANYIYCRSDLDDTTVQAFLDCIFQNTEELAIAHSAIENITPETAVSGLTVPLHPGAEAYFKANGIIE